MIHALKIEPYFFNKVLSGEKTFEIRENDRNFMEGDLLALNEYDPEKQEHTGRSCLVYVDFAMTDPKYVREGFAIMSIKPCICRKVTTPMSAGVVDTLHYEVPLAPIGAPEVRR